MVSFCCALNCNKKCGIDKSDVRNFLRFYQFPKYKTLRMKWIDHISRRVDDISRASVAHLRVCSDHFCDMDFEPAGFLKAAMSAPDKIKG